MPTRRTIKSVLDSFLGTYTSRNSDFRGYWLHGQLLFGKEEMVIDLLATPPTGDTPTAVARKLAVRRFQEQLTKSGLDGSDVLLANLRIERQPETIQGPQGDRTSDGHWVDFVATAVMFNYRCYTRKRTLFFAPHDPKKERRRLPADWGV